DPARLEEFNLRRAGGVGVARIRLTWQRPRFRLGFAVGGGVAYRVMFLERLVTAKEPPIARDIFVSDSPSYWSPVVSLEPSVMWRLTKGVAVSLAFQMLFETPSSLLNDRQNPTTQRERTHSLGTRALTTPSYELASNVQMYMGPVLGMMFGP